MSGNRRKALRVAATTQLGRPPTKSEMRRIKRAYTRGARFK